MLLTTSTVPMIQAGWPSMARISSAKALAPSAEMLINKPPLVSAL